MGNKEQSRELSVFPKAIDGIVSKKFGVSCVSAFDPSVGRNVSKFGTLDRALIQRINDFIDGFVAGNRELSERILRTQQEKG